MPKEKILIVDDEQLIRWTLCRALRSWSFQPIEAKTVFEALELLQVEEPAIILLDINLPDGSGLDILREVKRRQLQTVVIMITGNILIDNTIAALRGGAYDFISKPINLQELRVTIRNGIESGRMRKELNIVRNKQTLEHKFDNLIGNSPAMVNTLTLARKVAMSEASSVLLQGESGTGKDLLAKAIHYGSRRSNRPFVAINCAALPANLIESELFGYEKGAFTDARKLKEGLIEQAEGGTLFLDEIGELELSLQAKLLRVLEEGTFRRVGGLKNLTLDARIIAASNRDLKKENEAGRFRLDLYYRLSVIQIDIAPLRECGDDVLLLAEHFITEFNKKLNRRIMGLSPEVSIIFRTYKWPGNVRELRNCIERSVILEEGDLITLQYLPYVSMLENPRDPEHIDCDDQIPECNFILPTEGVSLNDIETLLVRQAIDRVGGNQKQAAKLLGISRDQLRYRLRKMMESTNQDELETQLDDAIKVATMDFV
jgi:two-component system, NtrC family, response regulator AtoC